MTSLKPKIPNRMLSMEEICRFAETGVSHASYQKAERILKTTNHLFFCGKDPVDSNRPDIICITARCLSVSHIKSSDPLTVTGEIHRGTIRKMQCTCPAGLGGKCKHIIATLLHCYG